ncbi:HNH endonuclease [Desulfoferula mesophila]|uniref:HNH endonuclease n=1 Tax=Desulfoferula mesophila TaxID=3058419 RepID=UPI003312FA43
MPPNGSNRTDRNPSWCEFMKRFRQSIWVYNGLFRLVDAWPETSNSRRTFKFRLELTDDDFVLREQQPKARLPHDRLIPSSVKLEVWKRDQGRCVKCGSDKNLHFDHIIPYSRGGSSLVADNIQLLCAKHNLSKRDKIQ